MSPSRDIRCYIENVGGALRAATSPGLTGDLNRKTQILDRRPETASHTPHLLFSFPSRTQAEVEIEIEAEMLWKKTSNLNHQISLGSGIAFIEDISLM
jgi:hypothetical protein